MSAIGGKADMGCCTAHVCFWPKADMAAIFMPLRPIEWVFFPTVKFQPEKLAVGRSCLPTGRDTFSLVPAGSLLGNAARMPWIGSFGLAVAIGLAYFLTARFSVGLVLESSGVAVFWPAAGISSGL